MKLGWKEITGEFKGVKWYDRKSVRDEGSLAPEEIKYIKSWTISPLGFGNIFYICKRVLPDILTIYIIAYIFFEIDEAFLASQISVEKVGLPLSILYWVFSLFLTIASFYNTYFLFRHGRRLSWNRGRYIYSAPLKGKREIWQSVQELKDSENRYYKYGTIPFFVFIGLLFLFILFL